MNPRVPFLVIAGMLIPHVALAVVQFRLASALVGYLLFEWCVSVLRRLP